MRKTLFPLCVVGVLLTVACTARPTYQCTANQACISESGGAGICEPKGFCSFADTACAQAGSGRRYSDGAGAGLDGQCVTATSAQKCISALSMGTEHSCLVKTDGSLWCWGGNTKGQLGDGTTVAKATPTRVTFPANVKIAQVATAELHTCALDTNGGVWCWGDNAVGQLGYAQSESNVPVAVTIMAGMPPQPVKASALAAGGKHTCAIANHLVYCWGENSDGQCGADPKLPGNDDVLVPTQVAGVEGIEQIAPGDEFTCARRDDKSVFCWGANAQGELGNGTTQPSFAPVKVLLSSVGQLTAGDEHACGGKDDGSIWCWGYGQSGSIGSGGKDDKTSPVAVGTGQTIFTSGEAFHTCAVTADGTLKCWGANDNQQIGLNIPDESVLTPTQVSLITVNTAALGGKHSCAVTNDGALWCWGANQAGQLGNGAPGAPIALPQRIPFACP
jgi:alpha-tubulin suppressor-like RCC1 family protein